jgi:tungstate transport system substrate-binding protein
MKKKLRLRLNFGFALLMIALMVIVSGCGKPARPDIILATTTSTQDSGLLDLLIPDFEKKTGYKVKTVAVGTGAALAMGEKGDADVMLVHAPSSEKKLVDNQTAINYQL